MFSFFFFFSRIGTAEEHLSMERRDEAVRIFCMLEFKSWKLLRQL